MKRFYSILTLFLASLGAVAVAQNEPTTVQVTYKYNLDGEEIGTRTVTETVGQAPSEQNTIPSYVTATGFPTTIVEGTTTYTIETSYNNLPFTVSTEDVATYYLMSFHVNNKKYQWSAENGTTGTEVRIVTTNTYETLFNYTPTTQKFYKWGIGGDWFNGFTFKSQSGKYVTAPGETFNNGAQTALGDEATELSRFMLESHGNEGLWRFKLKGKSHYLAHTSDSGLQLSLWQASSNYAGWPVYMEEVGDLAEEIATVKQAATPLIAQKGPGYTVESVRAALEAGYETLNTTEDRANCINLQTLIDNYNSCTDIQMPEDGMAYRLHNVQPDNDGYLLVANDNTVLGIAAYTEENKNKTNAVFVCRQVGDKYIFTNGQKGNYLLWKGSGSSTQTGHNGNTGFTDTYNEDICTFTLTSGAKSKVGTFLLQAHRNSDANDGYSTIIIKSDGSNFDAYNNSIRFGTGYSNLFVLEPVDYPYNNVTLQEPTSQAAGEDFNYATLFLPFATTIPDGVEAYTATREGNSLKLQAVSGTLPANTAAVLRSTEKTNALFVPAIEAGNAAEGNVLNGTINTEEGLEGTTYVLSGAFAAGIGFYPYQADYLPAGKAYLVAEDVAEVEGTGVKGLLFGGQTATAIDGATTEGNVAADAPYYDLSGRRVAAPAKGIYVRDGKIVFVK